MTALVEYEAALLADATRHNPEQVSDNISAEFTRQ